MGAPQGTKLGPWLWLVYINDLESTCKLVKYPDDLTMYAPFKKSADNDNQTSYQQALDDISKWAADNNMTINAKKSKLLHISLSKPHYTPDFMLDGKKLEVCQTAKLLGVTFDSKLTFSEHVDDVCSRLASKIYGMRVLKRLGMNSKGLKTYYVSNIRSVLTYASQAWASIISDQNMIRLTQIEKTAMKVINSDIPYNEVLAECELPPLNVYINETARTLIQVIHDNKCHPLNSCISLKKGRRTRVSSVTDMPVCRTTKLQNTFFYAYSSAVV